MSRLILVLCLFVYLGGCTFAQKGAMIGAYEAIEENDCSEAYQKLSRAEKYTDTSPELGAEITYLRAICLEKENKYLEAIGQYLYLIETYPSSEYSYRAKSKILVLNKDQEQTGKTLEQGTTI